MMDAPTLVADLAAAPNEPAAPHPWDGAAEGWDRHSPMLGAWLHDATEALLDAAGVAPGARVLDVAAGAGEQTLDIARRVGPAGRVLATDVSPRILALARAKLNAAAFEAVQTRVADAQALVGVDESLAAGGFDSVVCRLGLMFCATPLRALTEARAALAPGGRYAALVFSTPRANPCIATLMSTARRHAGLVAASPFEPGTLLSLGQPGLMADLLGRAGFERVEVRAIAAPMRLPSVRHYIDFVRSAGLPITALLAPLPLTARREAWQDIEQQLSRFTNDDNSAWVGPNELLLCAGTRPEETP